MSGGRAVNIERGGRADIRIRINLAIRIRIPDHFWLKFWHWWRFALPEYTHTVLFALCRVSEEGMKIVNTLETIREDVALGTQLTLPSYSATPHRVSCTPIVSPYGHHRYRHGQSLLNGLRSPPDMTTSHASRVSIQSGHESDITSQIHVCLASSLQANVKFYISQIL